ncbi:MAG: trigger factor [Bacteroidales bacterium]|nr:trigger factor [Bacteroidales bacterium]
MKINKNDIDALNSTLVLTLGKEDYSEDVEKVLRDYRKKANIPGFRVGKVPMGMVKKMYGTAVLVDEINKKVSHELYQYIYKEKLDILGEPLPNKEIQKDIDWEKDETFEFAFDIAVSPEFEVKLSKRDKINFYEIEPGDDLINKYIDSYKNQFGSHIEKEEAGEKDLLKGTFTESKEDGVVKEDAVFLISSLKNKKSKDLFVGKKRGDTVQIKDIKAVFENDTDLKSMLSIDDNALSSIENTFEFTIISITEYQDAELNQELFDKVFGKDEVKTEEDFKNKIIERAKENLVKDAEYKFHIDAKEKLISKTIFELPDEFLKRWLVATNEDITQERLDNEYSYFQEDMKWQLIKGRIIKDQNIEVKEEELLAVAKEYTRAQFQMYGSISIPDEYLESFAKEILQKKEERQKIVEQNLENKVVEYVKDAVKVEETSITYEEFNKFFEK